MSLENNKVIMNQVIEVINNRRSIRDYEPKSIPRDVINTIIEAGNQAPFMSEKRFQPWRFVVVENPEFKQKLVQTTLPIWKNFMENMKETLPEIYEKAMMLYETMDEPKDLVYYSAPVIIFVIGPARNATCCALACENIMLAATSLGLGSCYVGFGAMVTGNADVVQTLELTEDEQIYGPILLGYPKDDPSARVANALASLAPKKKEPMIKWI
jgi:nitroreductase